VTDEQRSLRPTGHPRSPLAPSDSPFHWSGNPVAQDAAAFLSLRKRWWVDPILVMLVLLGLLLIFTRDGRMAAFIYALF
jgi:hypothetical protein